MPARGAALLSADVAAPVDDVWALIRRFGDVGAWNPFIASSRLVSGAEGEIGAEREVVTSDGTLVRERLEALDEARHALGYRMLTFPIPVTDQRNVIAVSQGADDGSSTVTFSADFEPAPGALVEDVAEINRAAFTAAAQGLGHHLGTQVIVVDR